MKKICDGFYQITIIKIKSSKENEGMLGMNDEGRYFWAAFCEGIGIGNFQSSKGFKSIKATKANWTEFARINGIEKKYWEYE